MIHALVQSLHELRLGKLRSENSTVIIIIINVISMEIRLNSKCKMYFLRHRTFLLLKNRSPFLRILTRAV